MKQVKIVIIFCMILQNISYSQLKINDQIIQNTKLYNEFGSVYVDQNGLIQYGSSVGCDNSLLPKERLVVYSVPGKVGHCFLYEGQSPISIKDESIRTNRVQIEFSTDIESSYFVNNFSKSTPTSPGNHIEIVPIGPVSIITIVFTSDGYKPYMVKKYINTKDKKVSRVMLGKIPLQKLPCYQEQIEVTCDSTISSSYRAAFWYALQQGRMHYYYTIYDHIKNQRYIGEKCIEKDCFTRDPIHLYLNKSITNDSISSLLEVGPLEQKYIRILPREQFDIISAETSTTVTENKKIKIELSDKKETAPVRSVKVIVLGVVLLISIEILYRILWKKSFIKSLIKKN